MGNTCFVTVSNKAGLGLNLDGNLDQIAQPLRNSYRTIIGCLGEFHCRDIKWKGFG